jgi:hypothetical protein
MALRFGVYPGGAAGNDAGGLASGPPDDPAAIRRALDALEAGTDTRLLIRAYTAFDDARGPDATGILAPLGAEQYAERGRLLDLVVQYRSRAADVSGYARFVRNAVRRFGAIAATLQITEEPNVRGNAVLDGDYPDVLRAIVAGVAAARDEARACGFTHLRVGVNTTPLFGPASGFYGELVGTGGRPLVDGLDYIGLDMFPDVFGPVPGGDIRAATRGLLAWHRREILTPAGLGHLPLHVTEHGWPTGPGRTPDRQAAVLREVIETLLEAHEALGVSSYELFSLRDAESSGASLFHGFGIMTDRYVAKPAFDVLRDLIAQGQTAAPTAVSRPPTGCR